MEITTPRYLLLTIQINGDKLNQSKITTFTMAFLTISIIKTSKIKCNQNVTSHKGKNLITAFNFSHVQSL